MVLVFQEDDGDLTLDLDDLLIVGPVDIGVDGPNSVECDDLLLGV
jgi:hypothetical protein